MQILALSTCLSINVGQPTVKKKNSTGHTTLKQFIQQTLRSPQRYHFNRQCTYNVTLMRIRVTIVAVGKQ